MNEEQLVGRLSPQSDLEIRAALGIPTDAERVLLFAESSHWDTNWLETSEGYFKKRVEPILDAVLNRNADLAVKLLSDHIDEATSLIVAGLVAEEKRAKKKSTRA